MCSETHTISSWAVCMHGVSYRNVEKSHDTYTHIFGVRPLDINFRCTSAALPCLFSTVCRYVVLSAVGRLRIPGRCNVGPAINPSLPRVPVSIDTDARVVGGRGGGVRGCVVRHCHVSVRVGGTLFANGIKWFLPPTFSGHAHTKESVNTF